MKRLIIVGSPRANGRSAHLAEMLFEACIDECPDDELSLAPISELDITGCTGCGACEHSEGHACVYDDDMTEIRELMDEADELTVVSPVYFSGAPSQLKALLDRFQPYFWTWVRGGSRRPMTLHVIGEGGDPNGFEALVSEVRSAGAVAGFRLERIVDWVGKIDESGEIVAEGEEYVPRGQAVQYARIAAEDIENVHVIHEENVRKTRKANKAARTQQAAANKTAQADNNAENVSRASSPESKPGRDGGKRTGDGARLSHNAQAGDAKPARPQLNLHSAQNSTARSSKGKRRG